MPSSRSDHGRWCDLLVITGLSGFAISQPVLSVLGDHPTLFTSSGVDGVTLVVFVLAVAFVPPLVLWGIGCLARTLDDGFGQAVHLVTVGLLVALTTVQVAKRAGLEQSVALAVLSIAAGAAFSISLSRFEPVAMWARYSAVLPPLAVAYFLVASPSGDLVRAASAVDEVREPSGDVPSVVMIVLDELPTKSILDADGGLDRVRFPHLAAFADEATWYRHHTALSPYTDSAVPSLLTGNVPRTEDAVWTNYPDNLFTLLDPTHELEVFEANTGLCGVDSCAPTSAPEDADVGDLLVETAQLWRDRIALDAEGPPALDEFAEELTTADAEETENLTFLDLVGGAVTKQAPERVEGFIDAIGAAPAPAFYYLHVMLPHQPWKFHPDGELYDDPDPLGLSLSAADRPFPYSWNEWVAAVAEQRHLLQSEYTDRLLGQILEALRGEGLYEESLVIVTADHGVSFELRTNARDRGRDDPRQRRLRPIAHQGARPEPRCDRRHQRDGDRPRADDRRVARSRADVGAGRSGHRIGGDHGARDRQALVRHSGSVHPTARGRRRVRRRGELPTGG